MKGLLVGGMGDHVEIEVPQIPPEYVAFGNPPVAYTFSRVEGDGSEVVAIYSPAHES